MIDDLQTLCVAALRQQYRHSASSNDKTDNGQGSTQQFMMDTRVFDALSECVTISDKPFLVIEAARALMDAFDNGLTPDQREAVDFGDLIDLRSSSDVAVRKEAGAVIGEIVNSTSEALRNAILEPLVRGVQGDDFCDKLDSTGRIQRLVSLDDDSAIQRVIDRGVVPRFVEFMRPDEDTVLQQAAMRALMHIATGPAEHAGVVFRAGAIRHYVRLLQSSDDDVKEDAAGSLGCIASESTESRDFILRNQALRPLLLLAAPTSSPRIIQSAAWTIAHLCCCEPAPPFALVRPALPTLARLLFSSDHEVVRDACKAFGDVVSRGPNEQIWDVCDAGVCRRVVELLQHPSSEVQLYALVALVTIVDEHDQQGQAILDRDPLSCMHPLLSSPYIDVRERACWAIGTIISVSHDQLRKVFEYNLVPPLVQCLSDADLDVRESAACAVSCITSNSTHQQTQLFVQEGCIPLMCDQLASEDAFTVLAVVEFIERILLVGEITARRNGVTTNPMAASVSEAGGVAKMKQLAHRSPDEEYDFGEAAARVLNVFFGGVGDEGEENASDNNAVGPASAGPSGEGGDDGAEPPRQRRRRS